MVFMVVRLGDAIWCVAWSKAPVCGIYIRRRELVDPSFCSLHHRYIRRTSRQSMYTGLAVDCDCFRTRVRGISFTIPFRHWIIFSRSSSYIPSSCCIECIPPPRFQILLSALLVYRIYGLWTNTLSGSSYGWTMEVGMMGVWDMRLHEG